MTLPALRKPTAWDLTRLWLLGAIWGASFLLIEIALKSFSPLVIAATRIFVASLTLLIAALVTREPWPTHSRDWLTIFFVGIFTTAIPFYFISWGQQFVAGAETALLMATGTFFAMILAHFFSRDEKVDTNDQWDDSDQPGIGPGRTQ